MKKICIILFLVFVCSFNVNAQYVRKQIKPDFFMPEYADFYKPEKIPVIKKKEMKQDIEKDVKDEIVYENEPEFKKRFSEYSKDIENIAKNKNIENADNIVKDMGDMNSPKLIKVNKLKPISKDEISKEFDKILSDSLN